MKNIKKFLAQNPTFNLQTDNLARTSVRERLNWESFNKTKLLAQLQTFQRLHRIHPDEKVAWQLMKAGFHSAHQIATTAQNRFTNKVNGNLGNDRKLVRSIWHKSQKIVHQVNQMVMAIRPEPNGTAMARKDSPAMAKTTGGVTNFEADIPSYKELFGPEYFCECEECKSIWGPAAYYADLMRLIDQYITAPSEEDGGIPRGLSLHERRPDLWEMELSCANTFKEMPYLEIANEVMDSKLTADLQEPVLPYVAKNIYPFSIPVNLPEQQIEGYLDIFGFKLEEVFAYLQADPKNIARAAFGLSSNQLDFLTNSNESINTVYGLYDGIEPTPDSGTTAIDFLCSIRNFLGKTGLDLNQLKQLFFQNVHFANTKDALPQTSYTDAEIYLLNRLFINHLSGAGTFIRYIIPAGGEDLVEADLQIVLTDATTPIKGQPSVSSFNRLQEFIRLAEKINWSFADLDWALQTIAAGSISETVITQLAQIETIKNELKISVEQTVALYHTLKTFGGKDENDSLSFFDRVYNQPDYFNTLETGTPTEPYHPQYNRNPLYNSTIVEWNYGEPLSSDSSSLNANIKSQLLSCLQIKESDLTLIVEFLDTYAIWSATDNIVDLTVDNLTVLYRYSQLPKLVKMSYEQFFNLLPTLPDLPKWFIDDLDDLSKLLKSIKAAKASNLSIDQLNYLLNPDIPLPESQVQNRVNRIETFLGQLKQSAESVVISTDTFINSTFNEFDAEQLFDELTSANYINTEGVILNLRPIRKDDLSALIQNLWSPDELAAMRPNAPIEESDTATLVDTASIATSIATDVETILLDFQEQQDQLLSNALTDFYALPASTTEAGLSLTTRQFASAPNLTGTSSQGQYAVFEDAANLINPNELTLMLWVKFDSMQNGVASSQTLYSSQTTGKGFSLRLDKASNGEVDLVYKASDNTEVIVRWNHFETGRWYHISVSAQNAAPLYCYIDGILTYQGTIDLTYVANENGSQAIATYLGTNEGATADFLNGTLADVRIYKGSQFFSQKAVSREVNSIRPDLFHSDDLCAWWPMVSSSEGHVFDWSANGINGTIMATSSDGIPDCDYYNPRLLLNIIDSVFAENINDFLETNAHMNDFLKKMTQNLNWLLWNNLTPAEGLLIANTPLPFACSNMRYGFNPGFTDLRAISLYKKQCTYFSIEGVTYFEYLNNPSDANSDNPTDLAKQEQLAALADWEMEQLSLLIQTLEDSISNISSTDFNTIFGVQTLINCFKVSQTLGVDISVLLRLENISNLLVTDEASWNSYEALAAEFEDALDLHYKDKDLLSVLAPLRSQMEELKRSFQSDLLIWELGRSFKDIKTTDQLYEFLLIDVQMTGAVNISPLKLGLNSLQLYIQRCLTNLENSVDCTIPKEWWAWMSDYRTWQANREVYLYPENYVDPALRKLQTNLFSDLVNEVKQSPIATNTVTDAYKTYLNGLKDVANLYMVESCAYEIPSFPGDGAVDHKKMLTLFGRTKSDPTIYYYRKGLIPFGANASNKVSEESIDWAPWKKIELGINSKYLTSIFAFNKLFIFWVEQQKASSEVKKDDDTASYPYITAKISFAYQTLGEAWSPAQTLKSDILISVLNEDSNPVLYTGMSTPYYKEETWKKVQVWNTPASGKNPEAILVTLGDTVSSINFELTEPSKLYGPEQEAFYDRLQKVASLVTEISPNFTTVSPAYLLTASLMVSETNVSFDLDNTLCFEGQVLLTDTQTAELDIVTKKDFINNDLIRLIYTEGKNIVDARADSVLNSHGVDTKTESIAGVNETVLNFAINDYMEVYNEGVAILPTSFIFSCLFYVKNASTYHAIFDSREYHDTILKGITLYYVVDSGISSLEVWLEYSPAETKKYIISVDLEKETWYSIFLSIEGDQLSGLFKNVATDDTVSFKFTVDYTPSTLGRFRLGAGQTENASPGFYFDGYIKDPIFYTDSNSISPLLLPPSKFIESEKGLDLLFPNQNISVSPDNVEERTQMINGKEKSVLYFNGTDSKYKVQNVEDTILPGAFSFDCSFKVESSSISRGAIFSTHHESMGMMLYFSYDTNSLRLRTYDEASNEHSFTLIENLEQYTWYALNLQVNTIEAVVSIKSIEQPDLKVKDHLVSLLSNPYKPNDVGTFYMGSSSGSASHYKGYIKDPIFNFETEGHTTSKQDPVSFLHANPALDLKDMRTDLDMVPVDVDNTTVAINGITQSVLEFNGVSAYYEIPNPGSAVEEILPQEFSFSCSFCYKQEATGIGTIFSTDDHSHGISLQYNPNTSELNIITVGTESQSVQLTDNLQPDSWYTIFLQVSKHRVIATIRSIEDSSLNIVNRPYLFSNVPYTPSTFREFQLGRNWLSNYLMGYLKDPVFYFDPNETASTSPAPTDTVYPNLLNIGDSDIIISNANSVREVTQIIAGYPEQVLNFDGANRYYTIYPDNRIPGKAVLPNEFTFSCTFNISSNSSTYGGFFSTREDDSGMNFYYHEGSGGYFNLEIYLYRDGDPSFSIFNMIGQLHNDIWYDLYLDISANGVEGWVQESDRSGSIRTIDVVFERNGSPYSYIPDTTGAFSLGKAESHYFKGYLKDPVFAWKKHSSSSVAPLIGLESQPLSIEKGTVSTNYEVINGLQVIDNRLEEVLYFNGYSSYCTIPTVGGLSLPASFGFVCSFCPLISTGGNWGALFDTFKDLDAGITLYYHYTNNELIILTYGSGKYYSYPLIENLQREKWYDLYLQVFPDRAILSIKETDSSVWLRHNDTTIFSEIPYTPSVNTELKLGVKQGNHFSGYLRSPSFAHFTMTPVISLAASLINSNDDTFAVNQKVLNRSLPINGVADSVLSFTGDEAYCQFENTDSYVLSDIFAFSCSFYIKGGNNTSRIPVFSSLDESDDWKGLLLNYNADASQLEIITSLSDGSKRVNHLVSDIEQNTWYFIALRIKENIARGSIKTLESTTLDRELIEANLSSANYVPSKKLFLGKEGDNYLNGYIKDPVFKYYPSPSIGLGVDFIDTLDAELTSTNHNILTVSQRIKGVESPVLYFNGTSAWYEIAGNNQTVLPASFSFSCSFYVEESNFTSLPIFNTLNEGTGLKLYYNGNRLKLVVGNEASDSIYYLTANLKINTWYAVFLQVTANQVVVSIRSLESTALIDNDYQVSLSSPYQPSSVFEFGKENNNYYSGYIKDPVFSIGMGMGSVPISTKLASINNQRGWFIMNTNEESFLALPNRDIASTMNVLTAEYNSDTMLTVGYSENVSTLLTPPIYQYVRLTTTVVEQMLEDVFAGGLPYLLRPASQYLSELDFSHYQSIGIYPPEELMNFSGAYGDYFWELFYHTPMYLARSLQVEQQFQEATEWYDIIFNPMLSEEEMQAVKELHAPNVLPTFLNMRNCMLFRPFQAPDFESVYDILVKEPEQVLLYEYDPFDPNAIARLRPSALAKATVMEYISNLIAWGDYLFRQASWESINAATMYYTTARELLGDAPQPISPHAKTESKTYSELDENGNNGIAPLFLIDMEVELPSMNDAIQNSAISNLGNLLAQRQSILQSYFCVPSNTQLASYRKVVSDRLYKIRHGLTIGGQVNAMPLFQPPIDPAAAVRSVAGGGGADSNFSANLNIPYYRFSYLIGIAKNFTAQVIQFGGALLSAIEKQNAEHLSLLQQSQSNTILSMMTQIKDDQINQLYAQKRSLEENLKGAEIQSKTYQEWIDGGWNGWEIAQFVLNSYSIRQNFAASFFTLGSSALRLFPNVYGLANGGMNLGGSFEALGQWVREGAGILAQEANLMATKGSFERTNDQWELQLQLADNSIENINAQLESIEYQIESAVQDYNINQTQISQSNEIISFLQTKFSNEQLYQWMSGQVSTIYFQAYQIAFNLASMAQSAFQYEYSTKQSYISNTGWNDLYKGLMAGETLSQGLQQLEQAYIQQNKRSLEIQKTISLLQLDPLALVNLKTSGTCNFKLTEKLFDLDFPGHYKRKIKSIAITIPAIVGPYQNVHATLTQLSNMVLTEADLQAVVYALGLSQDPPVSVYSNYNSNQGIAISSANNDSGMFQLNFNDDRYLFFEGTGAVSNWQLDMPKASNQFNFESISDVIINIKYTAFDGGSNFRNDVLNIQHTNETGDSVSFLSDYSATKYISMRQYYGIAWQQFLNSGASSILLTREMFIPNLNDLKLLLDDITASPIMQSSENSPVVTIDPPAADNFDDGPLTIGISSVITDPGLWDDLVIQVKYSGRLNWD